MSTPLVEGPAAVTSTGATAPVAAGPRRRRPSIAQVVINAGILAALLLGIPYERGFVGFELLPGLWVSWWRVMTALGAAPAALQVRRLAARNPACWCAS